MGRILSRSGWDTNASWFTYKLSWSQIDHQLEDGNQFEFFRHGEWLTSERTGYDLDYGSSDDHNTLALENDPTDRGDYRDVISLRGSQWGSLSDGDPKIAGVSMNPDFVAVTGDATALYNSTSESSADILHASRSLVWLKPDRIVVYDRAASMTPGRFKRFWLNLATNANVNGNLSSIAMPSGQNLFVTTLLPANALIASELYTNTADLYTNIYNDGFEAPLESMAFRLRVEAPGGPAVARFLNVIQGADTTNPEPAILVASSAGTAYAGAVAGNIAVLFPVDLSSVFSSTAYQVPAGVTKHIVTGLRPGAGYTVTQSSVPNGIQVTIASGGSVFADGGGVLEFSPGISIALGGIEGNQIRLVVTGAMSVPVFIQASTNLSEWSLVGQATNGVGGKLQFDDLFDPTRPARFYRATTN